MVSSSDDPSHNVNNITSNIFIACDSFIYLSPIESQLDIDKKKNKIYIQIITFNTIREFADAFIEEFTIKQEEPVYKRSMRPETQTSMQNNQQRHYIMNQLIMYHVMYAVANC